MCGNIVCLAAVLLGVDARWPPLPDGGLQYVIQIEPQALERLESGIIEAVGSYVPPYVKDVRAYQIAIGTQRLAKNVPTPNVQSPILTGVDTDWVPLPAGGVECRVWIKPEVLDELEKPGRVIEGKIPANVKKLSAFTITVGTKPPAAVLPATSGDDSPPPVEARADQLPGPLITPPHLADWPNSWPPLPSIGPPHPRSPYTSTVQTIPNVAPWLAPSGTTPPYLLPEPPAVKPGAGNTQMPTQPASHSKQSESAPDERPQPKPDSNSTAKEESPAGDPAKPWLSLTVTLAGLFFASLGGNVFLFWITWGVRSRYRVLLRRMGKVGAMVRSCVLELERSG